MKTILKRILLVCVLATLFCTAAFAGGGYEFPMIEPAEGYFVTNIQEGYYKEDGSLVIWKDTSYSYEFDDNGNITIMQTSDGNQNETYTYTYDKNGVLTADTYVNINAGSAYALDEYATTYIYDDSGNLIEKNVLRNVSGSEINLKTSYTYDTSNRLIKETTYDSYGEESDITIYSYNETGQLIQKQLEYSLSDGESLSPQERFSYKYNTDGKCVEYKEDVYYGELLERSYVYTYTYDDLGNHTKITAGSTVDNEQTFLLTYEQLQEPKNPEPVFSDVVADSWYADAVLWAAAEGITVGTGDGHFSPDDVCSRSQVVTFLHRAVGTPAAGIKEIPFTDVEFGKWYTDAILWAYQEGVTNGVNATGTLFGITDKTTRSQIVTLLYRLAGSPDVGDTKISFADVKENTWYTDAVIWATKQGITNGTGNGFEPDKALSRAEAVTFLQRYFNS